jgi:hypothetical protein
VDRDVWDGVPGVIEVQRVADRSSVNAVPSNADIRTVIIPLGEEHYSEAPRSYLSLVPDARAIATLSNKASFAAYLDEHGLSKLRPTNYGSDEDVEFPFVLKRTDLAGGMGIEFVRSTAEFDRRLKTTMFRGKQRLLQAFVAGSTEYVTHCVCKDGVILWDCTFAWGLGSDTQFGIPDFGATIPFSASRKTLSDIAAALAPLRYSGPCCVNYKLLRNGDISISRSTRASAGP